MTPKAIINCTLKKKYKTEKEAQAASNYIWIKWEDVVDPYHCNICEGWHLTSRDDL